MVVVVVGSVIWDEQKVLGKVRACVKGRVAGGWRGEDAQGWMTSKERWEMPLHAYELSTVFCMYAACLHCMKTT